MIASQLMHQKLQRRSKEPEVEARKRRSSVNDDDDIDNEIKRLEAELARDMKLMCCNKISDLNRNNLRFRT